MHDAIACFSRFLLIFSYIDFFSSIVRKKKGKEKEKKWKKKAT